MTLEWIEPRYSKEQVNKAGKLLCSFKNTDEEYLDATIVFQNWRAAHAFPMQVMLDFVRKSSIRVDKNALAVQRLKRVPSILEKLIRQQNMSLSRMEDIGGCRIVVENVSYVNKIYEDLKRSRSKHVLFRERNYIVNPKESGYRGIHLIYKYNGRKTKFNGLPVEIQIRSKVQHSWATAVEVVGAFTKQALKASKGEIDWLNFFKYASIEFSKLEGYAPIQDTKEKNNLDELKRLANELDIFNRLNAFNVAVEHLTKAKESGAGYYILLLDLDAKVIRPARFNKNDLKNASALYDSEELKYKDDPSKDLVMVSAKSLTDLKKAYPNYFSDTLEFSNYLLTAISF